MKLYAYNKPAGEVAAEAEIEGVKVYPASELDKDARGLVIYTDDAACVETIKAKAAAGEMEFHVDTDRHLNYKIIQAIRAGVELADGTKSPECVISWTEANAFVINIRPCKKPLLDEIVKTFGCSITLIKKYRVDNLKIKKVALGAFAEYSEEEAAAFLA